MSRHPDLLAEDAESRARALDAQSSFIVEAPAGAGKTELLTQRYLRLLADVDEPEEIVAITFTNKAAAEMRERILGSLDLARRGELPAAPHRRVTFELSVAALQNSEHRGWSIAENPARLRVTTIDALCAGLARQMPILSRFGSQPRVTEAAQRHYEEAARRTLALIEDEGGPADIVAEALRHMDNDAQALSRLLAAMLARRDQWLRHAFAEGAGAGSEHGLRALVERDLAAAAAALGVDFQARLLAVANFAGGNAPAGSPIAPLAAWNDTLRGLASELPLWRGLRKLLLTDEGTPRKRLTKDEGFPAKVSDAQKQRFAELAGELASRAGAVAAIARLNALPDPRYGEEELRTIEALGQLLRLAAAQLWTVFREANETDFIEVSQRALDALGDAETPSDLALRLDYRIQHLLVDEFQDTSPAQVELLRRLTAGWTPGDGRTLFAVGDPMQSVYRFRKADVGLFLRAAEAGIGDLPLERLRLTRNNRSCAPIVEWINTAFDGVFPAQDDVAAGAIAYRPFAATREDLPDAGVIVHALTVEREDAQQGAGLEAHRVLEIVDAERAADPDRHIAVLVRARSHLDALTAEIRRHRPDLRFRAVEIEALAQRQVVQDLLALTRAMLHRADRVNWLAILRAPWCGLRLADLHALAADDFGATVWSLMNDPAREARLSADGAARLRHVREVLGAALAQRGRQRLARWIEGTWMALGGPACLGSAAEATDARAYLDLLDRLDAAGRFDLDRIEEDMRSLYAAPDATADGRLEFMTIHKSKGLEFDTVILPGLHRRSPPDDEPLMRWEEVALDGMEESLIAAPLGRRGAGESELPTPFDYIGLLERERAENEAARVLYVGATRAVRALHLVGVAQRNAAGEAVAPSGSFLGLLWDAVKPRFEAADVAASHPVAEDEGDGFVPKLLRVERPATPAALRAGSPMTTADVSAAVATTEEAPGPEFDAAVGTLVHAFLQAVAASGPAPWTAERLKGAEPAMRVWFSRRGFAAHECEEGARRVGAALSATLASEAGRWVLAPRADAAAELSLVCRMDGGLATQVVDRTFVEGGERWIVDYKTAEVEGDGDALARHAERFRPQLERYADLFAGDGLPLRLAIFYATSGRLVELQPSH